MSRESWACETCTFVNIKPSFLQQCEICSTKRNNSNIIISQSNQTTNANNNAVDSSKNKNNKTTIPSESESIGDEDMEHDKNDIFIHDQSNNENSNSHQQYEVSSVLPIHFVYISVC